MIGTLETLKNEAAEVQRKAAETDIVMAEVEQTSQVGVVWWLRVCTVGEQLLGSIPAVIMMRFSVLTELINAELLSLDTYQPYKWNQRTLFWLFVLLFYIMLP